MTDKPQATLEQADYHVVEWMEQAACYEIYLCRYCISGGGGECHSPGCALFLNRAPDIPVTEPMCRPLPAVKGEGNE